MEEAADAVTATKPWIPCPLAWPGAVSPTYVYRGMPSKVTCRSPSGRFSVPRRLATSGDAAGTFPDEASSGGHTEAQLPVQVIVPFVSLGR